MLGVMLDMARNAVMKTEEIKNFACEIKKMGYDTIALYLEDVFEIEGEPYFGHLRGRYSADELKEIDAFAKENGMQVIPCIQTLAHLNGIFRWKKYQAIRDIDDIVLVDDERTYELIDKMFATLRKCFKGDVVNIGMDEAGHVGLGKYLNEHGFAENRIELIYRHLKKVLEIAEKYGFKCMMWADMFFTLKSRSGDIKSFVPSNLSLCYWDYYNTEETVYDEKIKAHLQLSDNVVFAGGAWSWAGFVPQNEWTMKTMDAAMRSCRKNGIKDVIITMWGDEGKECSFYSLLPSLLYCAEVYLNDSSKEVIEKKFSDLFGISFKDFAFLDKPNHIADCRHGNASNFGLYMDALCGKFDYHITLDDGKECGEYAAKLNEIAEKAGKYAYLFRTYADLSRVLELKYSLGVNTRKAYKENNIAALKKIANEIYPELIKRTERFGESYGELWNKENKPYGLEVQQARIGGLIYRLKACMDKIRAYTEGKIEKIEELEAPVLPFDESKGKTAELFEHEYISSYSLNRSNWNF